MKEYKELTLSVIEEAVPADVWKAAKTATEKFFLGNLCRILGLRPLFSGNARHTVRVVESK